MSGTWFRGARQKLSNLKPVRVPESPSRAFRDLWPGDAARGQTVLRGDLEHAGATRPIPEGATGYGPSNGTPAWRAALHGFGWLRDLRALGTDAARMKARDIAADWLAKGATDPVADAPEVAGARLSAWLGHWDFVAATAEDALRKAMMARLANDARALVVALPSDARHRGALVALKGALAAAVALEEEAWITRCTRFLPAEIDRQILPDGSHVERSPAALLLALQDLIEIRNLLHGAGLESPPALAGALDRAAPALRLFRHGDGGLASFNGTREEAPSLLDLVLTQAQARGRAPLILPDGGFQRLQAGRTLVIADTGRPPDRAGPAGPGGLPRGADRHHHAGTLSFEMSVGRDRLIINCGAAPAAEPAWRDALRATAAHSTLTIADTNSSELVEDGLGRRPDTVEAERQEAGGAQWLEAWHDGWKKGFGAVHRRRLYLAESGDDLRGEDMVEAENPPSFAVRFHLHPSVAANLQEDGITVLLRLPSGAGWRLRAGGGTVTVEDSIHLYADPRRTQQVVVTADPGSSKVQWAIGRIAPSDG